MKIKARLIPILLILILMLGACRSNNGSEVNEISDSVFRITMDTEINIIHEDGEEILYNVRVNNGNIVCQTTSNEGSHFYFIEEGFKKTLIQVFDPASIDILDYTLDSMGNVYFLLLEEIDGKENIFLRKYGVNGEQTNLKLLNEFHKGDKDDCYKWKTVMASDENILVYSYLGYLLINQEGEILEHENWEEEKIYSVISLSDDTVFFEHYINYKKVISSVDQDTGAIQQIENIPSFFSIDHVEYMDHTALLRSASELFQYDYKEECMESLFRWSDYGIIGDNILMAYLKGSLLHCLVYENGELYDVLFLEGESENKRTEMVLGCIGEHQTVRNAVAQFNKCNPDYMITVVDYWNEDENFAINNIYNDILAGKGPDIIKLDEYMDDSLLGEKGLLENLNPYLDNSKIIGREDMIENLFDALLCNGKLYMLPTNFVLNTMITKTKWIPENSNWTVDDILSIIHINPELEELGFSKDTILYYYALFFIETGKDSGSQMIDEDILRKYLELANYMPDDNVFVTDDALRHNGKMLFESINIYNQKEYLYTKSVWGLDSSFVGFPDLKGNGMSIIPENGYGISAKSPHKDKAWEFIESYFTDEWQEKITPNYDFSIYSKTLDKQLKDSMNIEMYIDIEGNQKEIPILTYLLGDEYIEVYTARENDIDEIRKMISGVEVVQRNRASIINIIQEEASFYFAGQKNIEEVISIIKNRVNLFLNE